jgi:protein TonB
VVRIRPKDEKRRPISFAINWSSLQKSSSLGVSSDQATLIPAEVIQKVQPNFPSAARGSPIRGTVLVLVSIDKDGSVVSAKAIEGPHVFRRVSEEAARKWKFRPATRNGQPVESEQVVQFRFE